MCSQHSNNKFLIEGHPVYQALSLFNTWLVVKLLYTSHGDGCGFYIELIFCRKQGADTGA